MTSFQEDFLRGTILGDTHLVGTKTGAWLRFGHGEKQLEYLRKKVGILGGDYKSGREESYFSKKLKVWHHQVRFLSHPDFGRFYNEFYRDGKKEVRADQVLRMGKVGWAFWYMDDGTLGRDEREGFNASDTVRIYVGSVNVEKPEEIEEIMRGLFGSVKLKNYTGRKCEFRFNVEASQRFAELVNDVVREFLPYKMIRDRNTIRTLFSRKVG